MKESNCLLKRNETGDDYSRFGITHLFNGRVFVYDWRGTSNSGEGSVRSLQAVI